MGTLSRKSLTVALAVLSVLLGTAILPLGPLVSIGLLTAFVGVGIFLKWPESATLVFIVLLYSNTAGVLTIYHGFPKPLVAGVIVIPVVSIVHFLIQRREPIRVDWTFYLMLAFLPSVLLSSLFAVDVRIALGEVFTYCAEGLVVYFLIVNSIRTVASLKRVLWLLMGTAALLGTLSLYQESTGNYEQEFAGFAQRNLARGIVDGRSGSLEVREKVHTSNRAEGPIEDANRYAQNLLMVLPFSVFMAFASRTLFARIAGFGLTGMILVGLLLTYSRGAFLALVLIGVLAYGLRFIRRSYLLAGAATLAVVMATAVPFYMTRIQTLFGAEGLLSETAENQPDMVLRGRATEMLAAFNVFLDHPIVGVGPGQFNRFYSVKYMSDPDIAMQTLDTQRRAHNLYIEMAAQTGIVGFAIFLGILTSVFLRLWRLRVAIADPTTESSRIVTAAILSLASYLTTGLFLHLSHERYLWMFVALASAVVHCVVRSHAADQAHLRGRK